jgi:hypothetical protein
MNRPAGRDRPEPPVLTDPPPSAFRHSIDVIEMDRCATCGRNDVSFLVLDNRDMQWRCSACSKPADEGARWLWQE